MAKNSSQADLMKDLEKTRSELLDLKLKKFICFSSADAPFKREKKGCCKNFDFA